MRDLNKCTNDEIREEVSNLRHQNEVAIEVRDKAIALGCITSDEKKAVDYAVSVNKLQIALLSRIHELREKQNTRRFG